MAGNDRERRQGDSPWIIGEMTGCPDRERSFAKITKQRHKKSGLSQHSPDIFGARIPAAQVAKVLPGPHPDQVITGRETT